MVNVLKIFFGGSMEIFLMRHGQASASTMDSEPELSESGKKEIILMGEFFKKMGKSFELILTSTKKRAFETAFLLAMETDYKGTIIQSEKCSSTIPADEIMGFMEQYEGLDRILLVGHMPSLSRLGSLILMGKEEMEIAFYPASCLMIEKKHISKGSGVLLGKISPFMLGCAKTVEKK
jgi:phosphohistidine phosphatase